MGGMKQRELIFGTIVAGVAVWFITRELDRFFASQTQAGALPAFA